MYSIFILSVCLVAVWGAEDPKNQREPFIYVPTYNSYTVKEGGSIGLSCTLLSGFQNSTQIAWSWMIKADKLDEKYNLVEYEIVNDDVLHKSVLNLKNVLLGADGPITCSAQNVYGSQSRTVRLRVKSKLAPLWPSIGIILEILVLGVIFFVVWLKKRKSNKQDEPTKEK